eukprot:6820734-Karenia_brevis.AAC.1
MWNQGRVLGATSLLWTAGIVTPIDCGPKPESRTGRKLRPITLTESLVKFAESVGIDVLVDDIRRTFEPGQVGICTPDGNILLLRALQSWTSEMESANIENMAQNVFDDLDAVLGIDFTNAYGKFFRSQAIRAIIKRLPKLAGMVHSEFQNSRTTYWQRVNGRWVAGSTHRGGFQGMRL